MWNPHKSRIKGLENANRKLEEENKHLRQRANQAERLNEEYISVIAERNQQINDRNWEIALLQEQQEMYRRFIGKG